MQSFFLIQRIAQELSDTEQGKDLEDYHGTVTVLARTFIIKHADKDVRFYAACCFAHILRIYAPDPPYDNKQLWVSINRTVIFLYCKYTITIVKPGFVYTITL